MQGTRGRRIPSRRDSDVRGWDVRAPGMSDSEMTRCELLATDSDEAGDAFGERAGLRSVLGRLPATTKAGTFYSEYSRAF